MPTRIYLMIYDVLSVDILAKFQRPFLKLYNFTTRRQRIKTESFLDLSFALVFHYVAC